MFRYELHMHTSEGSACGKSSGADMVNFYIERGYAGMVVTDHFYHGNTAPSRDLPWREFIFQYAEGYRHAKEAAKNRDFDVFFGIEVKGAGWDEYLILGLEPDWYAEHPELREVKGKEFLDIVRRAGAFIIHAHPYRERLYMKDETIWLYPNLVDAVEVRNYGNLIEFDRRALAYAEELNLPMTGGSDNHTAKDPLCPLTGISLPFRCQTLPELIHAIREKKHWVMDLETVRATALTAPTFAVKRDSVPT